MQQTRNHMTAFTSARRTGWGTLLAGALLVAAGAARDQPPPPPPPPPRNPPPTPHLIFRGQTLYLEKDGAYARLRSSRSAAAEPDTVRVSPRTRSDSLADVA